MRSMPVTTTVTALPRSPVIGCSGPGQQRGEELFACYPGPALVESVPQVEHELGHVIWWMTGVLVVGELVGGAVAWLFDGDAPVVLGQ